MRSATQAPHSTTLARSARAARLLSVVQLGPARAAALAEAVAAVLPDLVQFQQRLRLRGERDEAPDAVRHGFARDERRD
jgi:hypothetical protein